MPKTSTTVKVNSYLKMYPEIVKLITYNRDYTQVVVLGSDDKKKRLDAKAKYLTQEELKNKKQQLLLESIRRTKTNISDIVLANKFNMWCTFTFNGDVKNKKRLDLRTTTDRYNVDLCKKKMGKWLNNQSTQYGKFQYLIVSEFHKDGALHFHAFFNDYKGTIKKTKRVYHGKPVYRLTSYKLGISDMQYIDQTEEDYRKISSYIKKYITKDMPIFENKNRYWCSQKLNRPDIIRNPSDKVLEKFSFDFTRKLENLTIQSGQLIVTKQ